MLRYKNEYHHILPIDLPIIPLTSINSSFIFVNSKNTNNNNHENEIEKNENENENNDNDQYTNSNYSKIPFICQDFSIPLLIKALDNSYYKCAMFLQKIDQSKWKSFVLTSLQTGRIIKLVFLFKELSLEMREKFIKSVSNEIIYSLASSRLIYSIIYMSSSKEVKAELIFRAALNDPELFSEIADKLELSGENGAEVASKLLLEGKWLFAMKIASVTGAILDFPSAIELMTFSEKRSGLKGAIEKMEKQMKEYYYINESTCSYVLGDGPTIMKLLGCGFLSVPSEYGQLIGFACLIVSRERKRIEFILETDPFLLKESEEYIKHNSNIPSAQFLFSVLINITPH